MKRTKDQPKRTRPLLASRTVFLGRDDDDIFEAKLEARARELIADLEPGETILWRIWKANGGGILAVLELGYALDGEYWYKVLDGDPSGLKRLAFLRKR